MLVDPPSSPAESSAGCAASKNVVHERISEVFAIRDGENIVKQAEKFG